MSMLLWGLKIKKRLADRKPVKCMASNPIQTEGCVSNQGLIPNLSQARENGVYGVGLSADAAVE